MPSLKPSKLYTQFIHPIHTRGPLHPRCYTLTHSDRTGDLFLTIAEDYDHKQISDWYTRIMRDEVLAAWEHGPDGSCLHVHCHVSGGFVFGTAYWRASILRHHLPQVIQAFRYGDRILIEDNPRLDQANVLVHFHARQERLNINEPYGKLEDYKLD